MSVILLKEEVFQIVGAAFDVYNELSNGFLEPVYQEAMELELTQRGIPFEPQKLIRVSYKGQLLQKHYCADLVCFGSVLVELKAISCLTAREDAQLMNYLKATGFRVGLLLNFGADNKLDWKRLVW